MVPVPTAVLRILWELRSFYVRHGAQALIAWADELQDDPARAGLARVLRLLGEKQPSQERWDEVVADAIASGVNREAQ